MDDLFDVLGDLLGSVLSGSKGVIVGAICVALLLAVGGYWISTYTVEGSATCTVKEKSFAKDGDGSTYRIATQQCGVLDVTDNWLKGFADSADIYYALEEGKTYHFFYTGYRIPLLSEFPKVYKVQASASGSL